jgi:ribosomal protein L7Ae-like RNA K-turn-binding protein
MEQKVLALLGFAQKAKKLVSGESAAEALLKKNQAKLIVLADDISANVRKKYTLWAGDQNVPLITGGPKLQLGMAIGQSPRTVIVVTDNNFAQSILHAGGMAGDNTDS